MKKFLLLLVILAHVPAIFSIRQFVKKTGLEQNSLSAVGLASGAITGFGTGFALGSQKYSNDRIWLVGSALIFSPYLVNAVTIPKKHRVPFFIGLSPSFFLGVSAGGLVREQFDHACDFKNKKPQNTRTGYPGD